MKSYIGCKIIQAERADRQVTDSDMMQAGYKVIYPDGYVSWSPEGVFENAYREITASEIEMVSAGDNAKR